MFHICRKNSFLPRIQFSGSREASICKVCECGTLVYQPLPDSIFMKHLRRTANLILLVIFLIGFSIYHTTKSSSLLNTVSPLPSTYFGAIEGRTYKLKLYNFIEHQDSLRFSYDVSGTQHFQQTGSLKLSTGQINTSSLGVAKMRKHPNGAICLIFPQENYEFISITKSINQ